MSPDIKKKFLPRAVLVLGLLAPGCKVSQEIGRFTGGGENGRPPIETGAVDEPPVQIILTSGREGNATFFDNSHQLPPRLTAVEEELPPPQLKPVEGIEHVVRLEAVTTDASASVSSPDMGIQASPAEAVREVLLGERLSFKFSELSGDPEIVNNARLFYARVSDQVSEEEYVGSLKIPPNQEVSVNSIFGYDCYETMPVAAGIPGAGACHAGSMLNEVASRAGLEAKPTMPLHSSPIGGVSDEYELTIWCSGDPRTNKDLLLANPFSEPVVIAWKIKGDEISFEVKKLSTNESVESISQQLIPEVNTDTLTLEEMRYTEAASAEILNELIPQEIKDGGFTGEDLVRIARKNNINPAVLWTFAWVDSHWGGSAVGKTGNVIGISTDAGPRTDLTVEQSIELAAKAMDKHLKNIKSFAEFANIWAPIGAPNDYNNTNRLWPSLVIKTYWEIFGPIRNSFLPILSIPEWMNLNQGKAISKLPCSDCVALTFDVEYGAEKEDKLPAILKILKENGILATFFVLGDWAKAHPDLVKAIVQDGHLIANHGQNHPWYSNLNAEQIKDDVESGAKTIAEITGFSPKLFRLPFGDGNSDPNIIGILEGNGSKIIGWSLDTSDWKGVSPEIISSKISNAQGGDIILMHPQSPHTPEALEFGIQGLKQRGFKIIRLDFSNNPVQE